MNDKGGIAKEADFNRVPTTVRRNAFLQGRLLQLPQLFMPRPMRQPKDAKQSKVKFDAREGTHAGFGGSTPRKRKLHAEVTLARVSRKQRNRLLAQKCRAAGVRNAAGLALAK